MTIETFLSTVEPGRKEILSSMNEIILAADKKVEASIGKMMGAEMILYHANGMFKYGLASGKKHMSVHLMPIYGSPELYNKYLSLLPKATFQKGCINFKNDDEMPPGIFRKLMNDSSKIDLAAIWKQYQPKEKGGQKKA